MKTGEKEGIQRRRRRLKGHIEKYNVVLLISLIKKSRGGRAFLFSFQFDIGSDRELFQLAW